MSEENTPEAADVVTQVEIPRGPGIRVIAQYIRDLSFENPLAPESLRAEGPPKVELDVELAARNRPDGLFEVDLKLITSAKRESEPAFHVEIVYGGLFQIDGVAGPDMEQVLLIECPRFLFPFARRIVADLTAEGGFPPFRIDPIDFGAIYMARQAQVQADAGAAPPAQA